MWLNPFPIIWRSEPARIELPAGSAVALTRRGERLVGWSPRTWFKEGCRGRITDTHVTLKRHRPFSRKDQVGPVLDAGLITDGRTAHLVGVWRMSWPERVLLSFWFGFVILSIPLCLFVAWASMQPGKWAGASLQGDWVGTAAFGLGPTAMFLFGRGMLAFRQREWEANKDYIARFITESSAPPRQP